MQLYANINFVPTTQRQWDVLFALTDDPEYVQYSNTVYDSTAYKSIISSLRQFHAHIYSNLAQYTQADLCVWKTSGLSARCKAVATQFRVPHTVVIGHANSTAQFAV